MTTVTAHCFWSQILYCQPHEAPWSHSFVLRRFPFTLKQQKSMFFSRLALSVTCTDTLRLSGYDCLQDDGMLEPGILRSRVAAHFIFHGDAGLNLRKHYHVPFTARGFLYSHHQRAMSEWYDVYTRVTHLHNRFQAACAIPWSIPGLCAISANTGHNHLRGARHFTVPILCEGLHPMLQENHHWAQMNWCLCHPNWRSLNQSYSLLNVVFIWAEVLNMCGVRWSADFVISISSLQKPTNLQRLSKNLMHMWIVTLDDFHACVIGSIGWIDGIMIVRQWASLGVK